MSTFPKDSGASPPLNTIKTGDVRDGLTVVTVFASSEDYAVYSIEDHTWFRTETRGEAANNFSRHRHNVSRLISLAENWVPKDRRDDMVKELASNCAVCCQSAETPASLWIGLKEEIEQHVVDGAGLAALRTALGTASIVAGVVIVSLWAKEVFPPLIVECLKSALCGMVGALASVIFRLSSLRPDAFKSRNAAKLFGILRPIAGCFFGVFAYLAIKANIIGGFAENNVYFLWALIFASGFSERRIPDAIQNLDARTTQGR